MNYVSALSNPNYKIGVKKLSNNQLKVGLPAYDMLESKINDIRTVASKIDRKQLSRGQVSYPWTNLSFYKKR